MTTDTISTTNAPAKPAAKNNGVLPFVDADGKRAKLISMNGEETVWEDDAGKQHEISTFDFNTRFKDESAETDD